MMSTGDKALGSCVGLSVAGMLLLEAGAATMSEAVAWAGCVLYAAGGALGVLAVVLAGRR